jgi:hypothetical protein
MQQGKVNVEAKVHEWTKKDKCLYILSMIPFATVFVGTAYVLATHSVYLLIILLALYVMTCAFQAGCCVGCPYRGRYCPALCGVYLGNLLSRILYKNRQFDPRFFKLNATAGETMVLVLVLYPLYWIFHSGWHLVVIYLALIAAHFILFMPTQCDKCSYNTTCPGGRAWLRCRRLFSVSGQV